MDVYGGHECVRVRVHEGMNVNILGVDVRVKMYI